MFAIYSGASIIKISYRFLLMQRITLYYSSPIIFWMNALDMSIITTSLTSSTSIVEVRSTDSISVFGDASYYLSAVPRCLFPPAIIIPLEFLSLFFFRNSWGSGTIYYYSFLRVNGSIGSIVLRRCSCFSSFETESALLVKKNSYLIS